MKNEQPIVAEILDELSQSAASVEDQQTLHDWEQEFQAERAATLTSIGHNALVNTPDGTLARPSELNAMRNSGQEVDGAYSQNRRA